MTELPRWVANLVNLEILYLHGNELTELPAEIGGLINLKELHLGGNRLKELPDTIGNLSNLFYLSIDHQQDNRGRSSQYSELKKLPDSIVRLDNLKTILLGGNNNLELTTVQSIFLRTCCNYR